MSNDWKAPDLGKKYRVLRGLGEGATGAVWEAENVLVGRRVAVKVMHPQLAEQSDHHARFLAEARAAARIAHRNVVDVYDLGISGEGAPYMVRELLHGETLDGVIERGAVAPAYAAELMVQVLAALEAAHALGIIHRDLKPANVFVTHPRPDRAVVKVLDFGIAQGLFADGNAPDEGGLVFGTLEYMSPEQAMGRAVDARSDVYAAGAVLYELLTGRRPFQGETTNALFAALLSAEPTPPRKIVPTIPVDLDALVVRTLAKNPAKRPQRARDLLDALAPFARPNVQSIAPSPPSDKPIPLAAAKARKPSGEMPAIPAAPRKPRLELVIEPSGETDLAALGVEKKQD